MNLGACATLPTIPEVGTWYRAVHPHYLPVALKTAYTTRYKSRYSPGPGATPPFEICYLAENQVVALFEVEATFGSPLTPGGLVPNPARPWVVLNVEVMLHAVVDLTDFSGTHSVLNTTVQELTGDWKGFHLRSPQTKVKGPLGIAPTQALGDALFNAGHVEGFRAVSAKLPYHEVLGVFPQRLRKGSFVKYFYTDSTGILQTFAIP